MNTENILNIEKLQETLELAHESIVDSIHIDDIVN